MMNSTINTALCAALFFAGCSKQEKGSTIQQAVPNAVVRAFQTTHPDVKGAIWKHDVEGFEAEWNVGGMEHGVTYDEKGTVLITEEQVTAAQMPASIQPYLTEKYADKALVKVGKETQSGTTTYEVELDNAGQELELIFDEQGNYLGTEADDLDGEGDQD